LSGGKLVADVESDADRRLGKTREEAIGDHLLCSGDGFFGGLADQHKGAVPGLFAVGHDVGGRDQRGHVEIVATGMHYGDVVSGVVFGMDFAGVGEAGFFFDGKGVEFGAEHDGRAGSVLEDGDNAGAADCFGDFVAQGAETSGEFGGGLGFVRGELGRLMKIEVEIVGGG